MILTAETRRRLSTLSNVVLARDYRGSELMEQNPAASAFSSQRLCGGSFPVAALNPTSQPMTLNSFTRPSRNRMRVLPGSPPGFRVNS